VILSKDADLSQAKQMLQKVKKNYEQGLRQNKKLAAQISALVGDSSRVGFNKLQRMLTSTVEHNSSLDSLIKTELDELKGHLLSGFKGRRK